MDASNARPPDEALDEAHELLAVDVLLLSVLGVASARIDCARERDPDQPEQTHVEPPQETTLHSWVANVVRAAVSGIEWLPNFESGTKQGSRETLTSREELEGVLARRRLPDEAHGAG